MNTDPVALRLAQFFEKICSIQHHLSAETALRVLKINLTNVVYNEVYDQDFRTKLAKIVLHTDKLGEDKAFKFIIQRERLHTLLELIVVGYESFEDFLSDYLRHDPDPVPIDFYWSSYRIAGYEYEQYIEEDYRRGLGIWTCRDHDEYMSNPFLSLDWRGRRQEIYPCCNLPFPRRKGHQLNPVKVKAALPKVPRFGGTGWAPVMMSIPLRSDESYQSSLVAGAASTVVS